MYKVLIVDDEPLIREGLRTIIEWEELGFTVAGVATDGLDALAKVAQSRPDVMLIDIRMPGMNGLALMKAVQERYNPAPRFIVLSGHADFEYARQALAMRADGYILKPVDEDELAESIVQLKRVLAERASGDGKPAAASWSRERTAIALLAGGGERPPEDAVAAIRLDGPPYRAVLIRLQSRTEIDAATVAAIKNRLVESFDAAGRGVAFSLDANLGLVLSGEDNDWAYREIRRACSDHGADFSAVGGEAVDGLERLSVSLRTAEEGMRNRFLLEGDRIYPAEEAAALARDREDEPDFEPADGEKLLLALDLGNAEAAAAWIRETGGAMREAGLNELEIKAGFARLLTHALARLEQTRHDARDRCRAFAAEVLKLYGEYRYSELLDWLTKLASRMADAFRSYEGDKQVQKMIELIRRNYAENLKLESLAELFGYNSAYLGKLFKNTTGEPFNTYLDKVRIEKAKELLEQGLKVYQVAERVGYSNVDYFHGKFRKYVGESPSAYRKK